MIDKKLIQDGVLPTNPISIPMPPVKPPRRTPEVADPLADLVSRFSSPLLEKLRAAEAGHGRRDDWLKNDWEADLQRKLAEHVAKGDQRDVAAYAAFAWHHGWLTAPKPEDAV